MVFGSPLDNHTSRAVNPFDPTQKERRRALALALVSILVKCSSERMGKSVVLVLPSGSVHFHGIGRYKADGTTEMMETFEFSALDPAPAVAFAEANYGGFN